MCAPLLQFEIPPMQKKERYTQAKPKASISLGWKICQSQCNKKDKRRVVGNQNLHVAKRVVEETRKCISLGFKCAVTFSLPCRRFMNFVSFNSGKANALSCFLPGGSSFGEWLSGSTWCALRSLRLSPHCLIQLFWNLLFATRRSFSLAVQQNKIKIIFNLFLSMNKII